MTTHTPRALSPRRASRGCASSERFVPRCSRLVDPERSREPLYDHATAVEHEQPRLGLEVEGLELRAQSLVLVVADEDLLVDEGDAACELLLQRHEHVGDRAA